MDGRMKLALIFEKTQPHTTGVYFERACQALQVAYDHWWLRDAAKVPATYDLYLRIDHGDDYDVHLPKTLRPSVLYAIDTHVPHSWRKIRRLAGDFDLVCCCHRDASTRLPGACWVPVGCDLSLYPEGRIERTLDLAFVGTDGGVPRKFYLQALRERYPKSFLGAAEHTQLGSLYRQARIGFN